MLHLNQDFSIFFAPIGPLWFLFESCRPPPITIQSLKNPIIFLQLDIIRNCIKKLLKYFVYYRSITNLLHMNFSKILWKNECSLVK